MNVTDLHPPLSAPKVIHHPEVDGEYLLNIAACVRLAREGDTPKAKSLYRTYVAEYRALQGQPLAHEEMEQKAWWAAAAKHGWKFVPLN